MAWYEDYIARVPGVQGGEATVRGTRTPVRTVVVLSHHTYPGQPDEVRATLPHLTSQQIEAGLAYYRDHTAEVEADIERHCAALRRFRPAS